MATGKRRRLTVVWLYKEKKGKDGEKGSGAVCSERRFEFVGLSHALESRYRSEKSPLSSFIPPSKVAVLFSRNG